MGKSSQDVGVRGLRKAQYFLSQELLIAEDLLYGAPHYAMAWICAERRQGTSGGVDGVATAEEDEIEESTCPLSIHNIWRALDSLLFGERVCVAGRAFRLERLLAEGGFSYIFLAHAESQPSEAMPHASIGDHTAAFDRYAVKRTVVQQPEQEEKAQAEAFAMRFVQHPALMPLIAHGAGTTWAFGRARTRCYFIVTPAFLEGSLVSAWDRLRSGQEVPANALRLHASEVLHIMLQLADGLGAMHARGMTHRDVTPSNALLDTSGGEPRAVLTDFGSCRHSPIEVHTIQEAYEVQEDAQSNTTAPYRPPELWYCQHPCTVRVIAVLTLLLYFLASLISAELMHLFLFSLKLLSYCVYVMSSWMAVSIYGALAAPSFMLCMVSMHSMMDKVEATVCIWPH